MVTDLLLKNIFLKKVYIFLLVDTVSKYNSIEALYGN